MNNFIWQINDCPDLDIDQELNKFAPHDHLPLDIRQTIERRILWGFIKDLGQSGFKVIGVYDGDEATKTSDPKEVLELAFNLDEVVVHFGRSDNGKRVGHLYFIWANGNNGLDCLSDWSWVETERGNAFNAAVEAFSDKVQE